MEALQQRMGEPDIELIQRASPRLFQFLQKWTQCPTTAYAMIDSDHGPKYIRSTRVVFGNKQDCDDYVYIKSPTPALFEIRYSFHRMSFDFIGHAPSVLLNGKPRKMGYPLKEGDEITSHFFNGRFHLSQPDKE